MSTEYREKIIELLSSPNPIDTEIAFQTMEGGLITPLEVFPSLREDYMFDGLYWIYGNPECSDIEKLKHCIEIKILELNDCGLKATPALSSMINLCVLDLEGNELTAIPDLQLPKLECLYLDDNRLSSVPDFSGMPYLEVLTISGNNLDSIPDFNNLECLRRLRVERNNLRVLPNFEKLEHLDLLSVDGNPELNIPTNHPRFDIIR